MLLSNETYKGFFKAEGCIIKGLLIEVSLYMSSILSSTQIQMQMVCPQSNEVNLEKDFYSPLTNWGNGKAGFIDYLKARCCRIGIL